MNKDKETDRIVNIEYPALSKARDTLNIQWYRSAMEPQRFRELSRRSDLKGWIYPGLVNMSLNAHLGNFSRILLQYIEERRKKRN